MKFLAIIASALLTLALFTPVKGECEGAPSTVTKLNFFDANLTQNTLHLAGGQLRYTGIGVYHNESIDLRVKVAGGNYTNIAGYWAARGKTAEQVNGKRDGGMFGNINLQTKKHVPHSGEGNFEFCIVKTSDESLVTLTNFSFTIWDLDWRRNEVGTPPTKVAVKEKLIIDTEQALNYSVFPNFADSEVKPICENGDPVNCTDTDCSGVHPGHYSCPPGVRTVFRSTTKGIGPDNPSDPETLSVLQRKRAVYFVFQDTSCFNLTYAHYCPVDDGPNPYDWDISAGTYTSCAMGEYQGGNFLFAGDSEDLWHMPGCPTASPTPVPSQNPAFSMAPSELPSKSSEPSEEPSKSVAPSMVPSMVPSRSPSDSPSDNPTPAPVINTGQCPIPNATGYEGSTGLRYGEMKMCVRSSLGYNGVANDTLTLQEQIGAGFKEVNFIESLITIRYNLDAGFCVASFNVEPKERLETTAQKDTYGLIAWLCDPYTLEAHTNPNRQLPVAISANYTNITLNPVDNPFASYFNQGALITVCVAPDDAAYMDGIRMSTLTEFNWHREAYNSVMNWTVSQPAIETSMAASNFLTAFDPAVCQGSEWCTFSSVLFADFYINRGIVFGEGSATLEFANISRRERRLEGDYEEEEGLSTALIEDEARERRNLQEEESPFDLTVGVNGMDDGPGSLRTAGGVSSGFSVVVTLLALFGAALFA